MMFFIYQAVSLQMFNTTKNYIFPLRDTLNTFSMFTQNTHHLSHWSITLVIVQRNKIALIFECTQPTHDFAVLTVYAVYWRYWRKFEPRAGGILLPVTELAAHIQNSIQIEVAVPKQFIHWTSRSFVKLRNTDILWLIFNSFLAIKNSSTE